MNKNFSRAPYDLDDDELSAAMQEAREFVITIHPWRIPPGHGTYKQKREGLGITVIRYIVDCSEEKHRTYIEYSISAWRTVGEERFGDASKTNLDIL